MSIQIISTDSAPAAIGSYSQAVKSGGTVYVSGQIPLDPSNMQMASEHFNGQAHQVFKNLSAIATAAGGRLANAVKLTVYVTDLGNFAGLNDVMAEYFDEPFPARAAVEVSALPKGALVEIDAVLCLD